MVDGRRIMETQGYIDKPKGKKTMEMMKTHMPISEKYNKSRQAEIEQIELFILEDIKTLTAEKYEHNEFSRSKGWEKIFCQV